MTAINRISEAVISAGHHLPQVVQKATPFLLYRQVANVVHVSGMIAQFEGDRPYLGQLGAQLTTEQGAKAAELSALNILAWLAEATGDDADRVDCCLELNGFVACTPDFTEQSQVISGASNLIVAVLGERGRHTRTSIGVAALPFGVAVEVNAKFVLRD
ncbi:RidA family protein [Sphingomonas koreensis]